MKKFLLGLLALGSLKAGAQKLDTFDIHQHIGVADSRPQDLIVYNDTLFFIAQDRPNGYELRKMAPGATFPTLVIDFIQGMQSGTPSGVKRVSEMGGVIYVAAADTLSDMELWAYSNGNATKVANINPTTIGSTPQYHTVFDEKLFFTAYDGVHGNELWYYDPQTKNAAMVQDLNPGTDHSLHSTIVPYKGSLYFGANDGTNGTELQKYSPIAGNISLVANLNPGNLGSQSRHILVANGKLYFLAASSVNDWELWSYDGTNPPVKETDLNKNGRGVSIWDFHKMIIEWNSSLFFEGYDSTTGFYQLCEFNTNTKAITFHTVHPTNSAVISDFAVYNNKLFFAATDGTSGKELWSYDGTNPPAMVVDINPGISDSEPGELTVAHGYLYFAANDKTLGRELFRYKEAGVSVENITAGIGDVKLYPNPAEDIVTLQFSLLDNKTVKVSVYDITGKTVYTSPDETYRKGQHEITIPVSDLPSGNYIYRLESNTKSLLHSGKFIKQ